MQPRSPVPAAGVSCPAHHPLINEEGLWSNMASTLGQHEPTQL